MKKEIAIIGGGACALMLASELDPNKFTVSIYEKNAAPGRKFLVAGDGGFNLTHSEGPASFLLKYTPFSFLEQSFSAFNNLDTINWLNANGIETFVGTSGRIFPKKGIKPIEVLTVFLEKIKQNGFLIQSKHEWKGFSSKTELLFENANELKTIKNDLTIFCLGGASWPVTGSVGDWANYFSEKNILVNSFEASNCSYTINWPKQVTALIEGKALKNAVFTSGNKSNAGEAVLTAAGIEGSGIYPLSPQIRQQLRDRGFAEILIDLKPALSFEHVLEKIKRAAPTCPSQNIYRRP